jgi:hypothetical protein
MTHGEFDLPVRKLSPALDDFLVTALRNTIDNVTDFEACGLQRQRECLKDNVVTFDLATIAVQAEPIRKKSRSVDDLPDRLRRDSPRVPGPEHSDTASRFTSPSLSFGILPLTLVKAHQTIASSKIFHFVFVAAKRRLFSPRQRHTDGVAGKARWTPKVGLLRLLTE